MVQWQGSRAFNPRRRVRFSLGARCGRIASHSPGQHGRVAQLEERRSDAPEAAGSTPAAITQPPTGGLSPPAGRHRGCGPTGKVPGLHPGDAGSIPASSTDGTKGMGYPVRVQHRPPVGGAGSPPVQRREVPGECHRRTLFVKPRRARGNQRSKKPRSGSPGQTRFFRDRTAPPPLASRMPSRSTRLGRRPGTAEGRVRLPARAPAPRCAWGVKKETLWEAHWAPNPVGCGVRFLGLLP